MSEWRPWSGAPPPGAVAWYRCGVCGGSGVVGQGEDERACGCFHGRVYEGPDGGPVTMPAWLQLPQRRDELWAARVRRRHPINTGRLRHFDFG